MTPRLPYADSSSEVAIDN